LGKCQEPPVIVTHPANLRINRGATTVTALNPLEAFLQKIAAQVGPSSPALAENLARNAAQLISLPLARPTVRGHIGCEQQAFSSV
jgi:hypothetical protein